MYQTIVTGEGHFDGTRPTIEVGDGRDFYCLEPHRAPLDGMTTDLSEGDPLSAESGMRWGDKPNSDGFVRIVTWTEGAIEWTAYDCMPRCETCGRALTEFGPGVFMGADEGEYLSEEEFASRYPNEYNTDFY